MIIHQKYCEYNFLPSHDKQQFKTISVLTFFIIVNSCRSKLEETKLKQKLREKPSGVNVIGLAIGKKITIEDVVSKADPFKSKSGGMVNMKKLKAGKVAQVDDAYDVGIGTQFSAETNKRDEDEEMMK